MTGFGRGPRGGCRGRAPARAREARQSGPGTRLRHAQRVRRAQARGRPRRCALAFLDQPIATVFADRLEQPVAGLCGRVVERDQGLVDELAEQAEDVARADARPGAHDLSCLERRSTDEGRQRPEHAALRVREQVVAPVEGGPERLLARQGGAAAADEESEAVVQPIDDGRDGQDRDARRRELDRERQPVEVMAESGDCRRVLGGQREGRDDGLGALREQPDRVDRGELARVHAGVRVGDGEGGHAKDDLARDPERLPAGGEDPQVRTPA